MENLELFTSEVKEYDNLDSKIKILTDKIKPLNLEVRNLKIKKSELQGNICEFMSKNDIDTCALKSGNLIYKETKSVKMLTQSDIKQSIRDFFSEHYSNKISNVELAEKLISYIYQDNREVSVKGSLRRSNN